MTPWRLLWRVVTGKDAEDTLRHAAIIEQHGKRIEALERQQDAKQAFRRLAEGNGK